jgi:hypothetical protein
MRWLRRLVGHIDAVKLLVGMANDLAKISPLPSLSVEFAATNVPGAELEDWRTVVKDLVSCADPWDPDPHEFTATAAIAAIIAAAPKFREAVSFKGSMHCEAILASLLQSDKLDEIFHEFKVRVFNHLYSFP